MGEKYRPEGETYEYSKILVFLESLRNNPEKMRKFREQAIKRAEDILLSSGLEGELSKDDKVLYIGSGTGHVAQHIKEKTGADVVMFDLVDIRTDDVKQGGGKFVEGNARSLPYDDGIFDAVCIFDMMHHTKNQEEIIKEAKRVLRGGGKFMALEDTIPSELEKKTRLALKPIIGLMDDLFNLQPMGVNPHTYHSIDEWEFLFYELGLKFSRSDSWYWGPADFMGASRETRPDKRTLARPFEATFFKFIKPE